MSSTAVASFTVKGIGLDIPPAQDASIGLSTTLRKHRDDLTYGISFTEASLKDPSSCRGVSLFIEKPLGGGIKGAASYDVNKRAAIATLTLNKAVSRSDVQLRAIYKQSGDVFILEEQWRLDANNKISGSYNFSNEEAEFSYTHARGDWSGTSRYNFRTDATILEVNKKQGKSSLTASYNLKDEGLTISWNVKPYKAVLKGRVGSGGVSAPQASLVIAHEFDL